MDVELADGRILVLADRFNLDHSRSGVFTAARWRRTNAPAATPCRSRLKSAALWSPATRRRFRGGSSSSPDSSLS